MMFQGSEVITKFDKRLDFEEWMSDADIVTARIQLRPERNRIIGEVSGKASGWSWIELQYPKQTRLVYCGFGLIKRWDDGPTPRYLMVRLLEHLTQQSAEKAPENSKRKTP